MVGVYGATASVAAGAAQWRIHSSERIWQQFEIERRALLKLGQHPELLALWRQYLASELTEHARRFSVREIQALLAVVRRRAELEVVLRFLQIIPH